MRIPISRRRCRTKNDNVPYVPTTDRTSASPAKQATSGLEPRTRQRHGEQPRQRGDAHDCGARLQIRNGTSDRARYRVWSGGTNGQIAGTNRDSLPVRHVNARSHRRQVAIAGVCHDSDDRAPRAPGVRGLQPVDASADRIAARPEQPRKSQVDYDDQLTALAVAFVDATALEDQAGRAWRNKWSRCLHSSPAGWRTRRSSALRRTLWRRRPRCRQMEA